MTRFTYTKLSESGDWILAERNPSDGSPSLELTPSSDYGITASEFKGCPFLSDMFDGVTPLLVLVNGSNPSGMTTTHSDYDLEVFVSEETPPRSKSADGRKDCVCFYKGRLMHWYYKTIKDLDDPIALSPLMEAALLDYSWQRQDCILWESPDSGMGKKIVPVLRELSGLESALLHHKMLGNGRFLELLRMGDDGLRECGKLLWTAYYQCCRWRGREPKPSTILALKAIRKNGLPDEDRAEFMRALSSAFSGKESYDKGKILKICLDIRSLWRSLFVF